MYISDLPSATPGSSAEVAFDQNSATYKASVSDFYKGMISASDSYKVFGSIIDLPGYTSDDIGSATITGAWTAMSDRSILICNATEFASGQTPTAYGLVHIIKYDVNRSVIQFFAKPDTGDYRMFQNQDNSPTGTWVKVLHADSIVIESKNKSSGSVSAGSAIDVTLSVTKEGYTPIGLVGWNLDGTGVSYACVYRAYLNGTTAKVTFRNTSTSAVTLTVYFYVMYLKN